MWSELRKDNESEYLSGAVFHGKVEMDGWMMCCLMAGMERKERE